MATMLGKHINPQPCGVYHFRRPGKIETMLGKTAGATLARKSPTVSLGVFCFTAYTYGINPAIHHAFQGTATYSPPYAAAVRPTPRGL